MDRGLIVLEDSPTHRELLREAGEHAAGVGGELYALALVSSEGFDDDVETLEAIRSIEDTTYSSNAILEAARTEVEEIAAEELDDLEGELSLSPIATVFEDGERADEIIATAAAYECDHVFLVGRNRSPTGKVIFGNVAQRVILNFDGYVTLSTE